MKIIVFDTETTGLPEGRNPSICETKKWPHIVQLSYILYDTEERRVLMYNDDIIRISDDVKISEESSSLHGITRSMCKRKGISIRDALDNFNKTLIQAEYAVGHNISFDKRVIMVESIRNKMSQYFTIDGIRKKEFCTMKSSVDICKIEKISRDGEKYFKYPSLTDLYGKFFGKVPKNIHNSLVDVIMCLRCYCKITGDYDVMKMKCNFINTLYKLTME
jgi:DNA polymerase III epsilon subunit-like protein